MTQDVIDTQAITIREAPQPVTLFQTDDPAEIIVLAERRASVLKDVIIRQHLSRDLGGTKPHVEFEGWTTLGSLNGVFAKVTETEPDENGRGFLAKAIAVTINGAEVGGAEASCSRDEDNWSLKPDFQIRSMAQTRACAKALRIPLGWIMVLAGYEATPAEELREQRAAEQAAMKRAKQNTDTAEDLGKCPMGHRYREREGFGIQCVGKNPDGSWHNFKKPIDTSRYATDRPTNDAESDTRHHPIGKSQPRSTAPKAPAPTPSSAAAPEIEAWQEEASSTWDMVNAWAKEHQTDPNRLRFYMATDAGVPGKLTEAAFKTWLDKVGPDFGTLYNLYVEGEENAQPPATGEQGKLPA